MGNYCKNVFWNPQYERAQYFLAKSSKNWIQNIDIKNHQKIITSQAEPQQFYCLILNSQDPTQGIIFSVDSFYEGEIHEKKASGVGIEKFLKQRNFSADYFEGKYEGHFLDNQRHDTGIYSDEYIEFSGQWKRGVPLKGQLIVKDRKAKGDAQIIKPGKYLINLLQFNNEDLSTGSAVIIFPDGMKYEGEIVHKKDNRFIFEGRGILSMPNKDIYDGGFKNGKMDGFGTYTQFNTNKKYEGEYKDGLKHGLGKQYISRDIFLEGRWINGKKQGEFIMFKVDEDGNRTNLGQTKLHNDRFSQQFQPPTVQI